MNQKSLSAYVAREFQPEAIETFNSVIDPQIKIHMGKEMPDPAQYDVLVNGRPTEEELLASRNLKTLIVPFAGVPPKTLELMKGYPDIAVHNLHWNADETAEMALALMLSASKMIVPHDRVFRTHNWRMSFGDEITSQRLAGRNALVLGFGEIGQRIARGCVGMGMNVSTLRKNPQSQSLVAGVSEYAGDKLHELLSTSNVLVIALPLTAETEGMLGEAELSALPKDAILVNIGRGKIVDEKALYESLKNQHLHSAGLDVWYQYPENTEARDNTQPSQYPFHELDNVVMSPHRAADSADFGSRWTADLAEKLNMLARGEALPHRVNIDAGY